MLSVKIVTADHHLELRVVEKMEVVMLRMAVIVATAVAAVILKKIHIIHIGEAANQDKIKLVGIKLIN